MYFWNNRYSRYKDVTFNVLPETNGSFTCESLTNTLTFSRPSRVSSVRGRPPASSQTVVHAQGALQLLDNTLVEGYLLREVGLHHVFEVHFPLPMEVAHLCLEGKAHRPAAFPNAVGLVLVHLPLVTHPLALLHLGKGTCVRFKNSGLESKMTGSLCVPLSLVLWVLRRKISFSIRPYSKKKCMFRKTLFTATLWIIFSYIFLIYIIIYFSLWCFRC